MCPLAVPPHLPLNRAEANLLGILGPTRADVEHFNTNCKTLSLKFSQGNLWDAVTRSRKHDPDWFRAVQCANQPKLHGLHAPGTFTGRWQGSLIVRSFVLVFAHC